jgi:flavin reductase (DIM6/NTAB) family NADH-FMN oxidoreductase RutF
MTQTVASLLGALDYPMVVVTAADDGELSGCLVGFHTQCSMDPMRFLVLLSNKNRTCEVASGTEMLAVHFLTGEQAGLAELFGTETGDEVDKFSQVAHTAGPDGVPLLDDCSRRFVGRVRGRVALGDHTGFLLEPIDAEFAGAFDQLGFQEVKDLDPGHQP